MTQIASVAAIQRIIPTAANSVGLLTPGSPTSMWNLVGANVMGEVITHPRRITSSIIQGASGAINLVRGQSPESHAILRTTTSILAEEMQNAAEAQVLGGEAVIEAINTGSDVLTSTLSNLLNSSLTRQRNIMMVCSIVPVFIFGSVYLSRTRAMQKVSSTMLETIPSKAYIEELVKVELLKQSSLVKPTVMALTAQQIFLVGSTGVIAGCLITIVVLKFQEKSTKTGSFN